ncbi:MAG: M23 family metallopeptidase [Candidatus Diapherotrites archaeon]|nr:M23 family metallopeptidase [Candidatus Diapherotrites archaeon]
MADTLKIVVVAIAAAALLGIFAATFGPLFNKDQAITLVVERQLTAAEQRLGVENTVENVVIKPDETIQAKTYESDKRSVAFECNNPQVCCPKGQACGRIKWDERSVAFNEFKAIRTSSRCGLENGIFLCKIYLGQTPAQIDLNVSIEQATLDLGGLYEGKSSVELDLNLPKKLPFIDLAKGEALTLRILVKNSGRTMLPFAKISAELFRKETLYGQLKLEKSDGQATTTANILPDEARAIRLQAQIRSRKPGEYVVKVRVDGEDAGFREQEIHFQVVDSTPSKCAAVEAEEADVIEDIETGKCKSYLECSECSASYECADRWKEKLPETEIISADAGHAWQIMPRLENGLCRADYTETPEDIKMFYDAEQLAKLPENATPEEIQKFNSSQVWVVPIAGAAKVSFAYGVKRARYAAGYHTGADFSVPSGTPVLAAGDGIITEVSSDSSFGKYVKIKHGNGQYTFYAHLSEQLVKKGDFVRAGQTIGLSGATGNVRGAHLHFELRNAPGGYYDNTNPCVLFPQVQNCGAK